MMLARRLSLVFLLTSCALLAFASPASAQEPSRELDPQAIVEQAKVRRDQAASDLAARRSAVQQEREAALQRVRELQAEVLEIEREVGDAEQAMREQERAHEQAYAEARALELQAQSLAGALARASRVELPEGDALRVLEALAPAIRAELETMLAESERALDVSFHTQPVIDRAGNLRECPVLTLSPSLAVALGDSPALFGALIPASGAAAWSIAGPEEALPAQPEGGERVLIPLAPLGAQIVGLQAKAFSLLAWLRSGGVFVWPILVVGLLGLLLAIERAISLRAARPRRSLLEQVAESLARADLPGARLLLERPSSPQARVLLAGVSTLSGKVPEREALEATLDAAIIAEEPKLERSLALLAALAAIAPLLGLLGTVTGMIETFDVLAAEGAGDPQQLSGGISVALTTTQLGLIVAVPLLLLHAWLKRVSDHRLHELDLAAQLLLKERAPGDSANDAGEGEA